MQQLQAKLNSAYSQATIAHRANANIVRCDFSEAGLLSYLFTFAGKTQKPQKAGMQTDFKRIVFFFLSEVIYCTFPWSKLSNVLQTRAAETCVIGWPPKKKTP